MYSLRMRRALNAQLQRNFSIIKHQDFENFHVGKLSMMMFGATTDVGKTIISAGICKAALSKGRKVCYIKPVQTGEMDEYFIQFYANPKGLRDLICRTIHHFSPAISPHIAAEMEGHFESDTELRKRLLNEIEVFETSVGDKDTWTVVETAGGVLSPGPSRALQADVYRPLRLPVILVGDAKLGGITTTLSAIESLRLRGYTVHAVAIIETEDSAQYGNRAMIQEQLEKYFSPIPGDCPTFPAWSDGQTPKVFEVTRLPHDRMLHNWFADNSATFEDMYNHVRASIAVKRVKQIEMLQDGASFIWYPFTQHGPKQLLKTNTRPNINFIDSAFGDNFLVLTQPELAKTSDNTQPTTRATLTKSTDQNSTVQDVSLGSENLLDASSSWWTQGVGHGHPDMSLAIASAAGRYGHVLLPGNLHAPIVQLSRYLVQRGPGANWASRCFYSDNGSTAMEIAVKIGLRLGQVRRRDKLLQSEEYSTHTNTQSTPSLPIDEYQLQVEANKELIVLGQHGSYHGDTLGAMMLSGPTMLQSTVQHPWYAPKVRNIAVPYIVIKNGIPTIDADTMSDEVKIAVRKLGGKVLADRSTSSYDDVAERVVDMTTRMLEFKNSKPTTTPPQPIVTGSGSGSGIGDNNSSSTGSSSTGRVTLSMLFDVTARQTSLLEDVYEQYVIKLLTDCTERNQLVGSLIIEPVMMGAGGFKFVDPLFQHVLIRECRKVGIPIVTDEVATGMWRLGPVSATSGYLKIHPDVAAYAKLLSGGYLPLAVTLTSSEAFDSFRGADKASALLHGHSYAGNPISCSAALEAIRIFEHSEQFSTSTVWMGGGFSESDVRDISRIPGVKGAMGLGSVIAVELTSDVEGYASNAAVRVIKLMVKERILARPLGNVVYVMISPISPPETFERVVRVLKRSLTRTYYHVKGDDLGEEEEEEDKISSPV